MSDFRSLNSANSRARRVESVRRLCSHPPYPSGDGSVAPMSGPYPRPLASHVNNGFATLFQHNNEFGLQRRASVGDSSFLRTFRPKEEDHETPIHQISRTALDSLTRIITSDQLRNTASTIFHSAVRVGSQIFSSGIQAASNLFRELEPELPAREDQVLFKGFGVKTYGNSLTLRSVCVEETGMKVNVHVAPRLTTAALPTYYGHSNLSLTFQFGNIIQISLPSGAHQEDISWEGPDNEGMLVITFQ